MFNSAFLHFFFLVRGQQMGGERMEGGKRLLFLSVWTWTGVGEDRECQIRKTREKNKWKTSMYKSAESSSPAARFHYLPPFLFLFVLAQILPRWGAENEKGALVPCGARGFLHWRKVWPLLLGRKAQEKRNICFHSIHNRIGSILAFRKVESRP